MANIRLSYTANNKYQDSPRAWYLHYVRKLREEVVGSALPFGNAMDIALNLLLENKGNPSALTMAENLFTSVWEKQKINGKVEDLRKTDKIHFYKSDLEIPDFMLTDEDRKMMEKFTPAWVTLRRKGLEMLSAYQVQVIPHISEVVVVQDYARIDHDDGDYIMGYVDLVARWELNEEANKFIDNKGREQFYHDPALAEYNGKIIIFDNKTSSQKYKEDAVRESGQLGTYAENKSEKYEADYEGYIVVPKKFRKTKEPFIPIQIMIDQVSDETIQHQFHEYQDTLTGIRLGRFPCTGCRDNPFGCAYKKYCASNGTDTEGLIQVGKDDK